MNENARQCVDELAVSLKALVGVLEDRREFRAARWERWLGRVKARKSGRACERWRHRFYAVRRYPGYVYYQTEIRDNYEVVSAGTAAPGRRWAGPGRGARAAPASERRARREGSEARGCGGPWSRARDRAL